MVAILEITTTIWGFLCAITLFIAIIYDVITKKLQSTSKEASTNENKKTSLTILTYIAAIGLFLHIISIIMRFLFANNDLYCLWVSRIGVCVFTTNRSSMYLLFI